MHDVRSGFIATVSSGKIYRALCHNVKSSGDVKYFTGDSTFYKRSNTEHWKCSGVIIGQDDLQVFDKHGSTNDCVYPCRLPFKKMKSYK